MSLLELQNRPTGLTHDRLSAPFRLDYHPDLTSVIEPINFLQEHHFLPSPPFQLIVNNHYEGAFDVSVPITQEGQEGFLAHLLELSTSLKPLGESMVMTTPLISLDTYTWDQWASQRFRCYFQPNEEMRLVSERIITTANNRELPPPPAEEGTRGEQVLVRRNDTGRGDLATSFFESLRQYDRYPAAVVHKWVFKGLFGQSATKVFHENVGFMRGRNGKPIEISMMRPYVSYTVQKVTPYEFPSPLAPEIIEEHMQELLAGRISPRGYFSLFAGDLSPTFRIEVEFHKMLEGQGLHLIDQVETMLDQAEIPFERVNKRRFPPT